MVSADGFVVEILYLNKSNLFQGVPIMVGHHKFGSR